MSWDKEPQYENKPKEFPEDGFYDARLVWMIDLGTNESTWEGVTTDKRKLYLAWEFIGSAMSDLRPFIVGNEYTISNGQFGPYIAQTSNLFKLILRPWVKPDGEAATKALMKLGNLAAFCRDAKPCKLTISNETSKAGKRFIQINAIKPHLDPTNVPQPDNMPLIYAIDGAKKGEKWDAIPKWLQQKIEASKEMTGRPYLKKGSAAVPNSNGSGYEGNFSTLL